MTIDPYAPCPGGLNKKVKFCCPDLVSELDQIQRMLEGDQRQACLDHIGHLEAKFPNRACLETTKALLQGELGMVQEAQQTIEHMLQAQPDNPVALAESAMLAAGAKGGREGVALLQRAIAASGREISPKVAEGFFALAQVLLGEGHVLAARGHLLWLLRIDPNHQAAMELLLRMLSAPSISPLYKVDKDLSAAPPDVSWRVEFDAALQMAADGRWLEAATRFGALGERVVAAPELWRNLALVRGWIADDKGAAAALHRLATLAIPLDDAVESEALALMLDAEAAEDTLDELQVTYTVHDVERVLTALSTSKQTTPQPVQRAAGDDQPPPRAIFWLIDRPVPDSGAGLKLEDMPAIIGQGNLFGRETDREARLEVTFLGADRTAIEALLGQLVPDVLTPAGEEVSDHVPLLEHILSWRWRPPDGTPSADVQRLLDEQRRRVVLETWPNSPMKIFGGRAPAVVAGDASQRVRLLAQVLHLEMALDVPEAGDLTNELRQQLGLPQSGPIDPSGVALERMSTLRYARVMLDKLSDEDLIELYQQASVTAARAALSRLGEELVRRPTLDSKIDKAGVYGMLAALERNPQRAIERLDEARHAAQKAGRSCARWDLEAFSLRVQRGESQQAGELLEHLQVRHGNEPGVRQTLTQLLYEIGAIGPDGRAAAPPAASPAGIVVPGGAAAEGGGIWTPGAEAPAGKKSSLWVPGME